jgi:hypothetical protein
LAKALTVVLVTAAAAVASAVPAGATRQATDPAPEPHFNLTPSFLAYTDAATPNETTFYPSGGYVPVGSWQDDAGPHTSRVYLAFDIGGIQRVRLQNAVLVAREGPPNDCTKPRSLTSQATSPFESDHSWANPPDELGRAVPAVPAEPGCASFRITFDLTDALDRALRRNETRLWAEIRVPKKNESKVPFGRLLETNEFRFEVTLTNRPPGTPTRLSFDGNNTPCGPDYFARSNFSVYADITDPDRSPSDLVKSEIEFWPASDPTAVTSIETFHSSGGDGLFGVGTIPAETLPDGPYAWHARSFDGRARSAWSVSCPFTVDRTVPGTAPTVSSPEYPENPPAPTGNVHQEGTFLFTANGVPDIDRFLYGDSQFGMFNLVPADQVGGAATIQWAPRDPGVQSLFVASLDRAGNRSPVREYRFNVRSLNLTAWQINQEPDPTGTGMAVTMHFATQVGNGITTVTYAVNGGPAQSAPMGAEGFVDVVLPPLPRGEHRLDYSGRAVNGDVLFESFTTFFVLDQPDVVSDGVYPLDGSGGGVGVTGVFTVTPLLPNGAQDVQYFTTAHPDPITVPLDADGKARINWTPAATGFHYFWITIRYTDGSLSSYRSFAVTVLG